MESHNQENKEGDFIKDDSKIHQFEKLESCEKGDGANLIVAPVGNDDHDIESSNKNHRDGMDDQLDADNCINTEYFDRSPIKISGPKRFMEPTKSSIRKSKFWNETQALGLQLISNEASNFQNKPGIRASGSANTENKEDYLVQTQQNTAPSTGSPSKSISRWISDQVTSSLRTSTSSINKTQSHRSYCSRQQVQAQEATSQSTKNPEPSAGMQKSQSTCSTNGHSESALKDMPKPGNPPSEISSKAHENSAGQQGKAQKTTKQSTTKNPSIPVQRSKVQFGSSYSTDSNRSHRGKNTSSQKVLRAKTKQQQHSNSKPWNLTPPSSSIYYSSSPTSPIYYISCDGSVQTPESATQKCAICEGDLCSPFMERKVINYEEDESQEEYVLPLLAVLACGHAFHPECLDCTVPEDHRQSSAPPCLLCLSTVYT